MKILIILHYLSDMGGITNYYNCIIPLLNKKGYKIEVLEVGSKDNKRDILHKLIHPFCDQLKFINTIIKNNFDLIIINTTLHFKSILRDGCFVYLAKKRDLKVLIFFRGWNKNLERKIRIFTISPCNEHKEKIYGCPSRTRHGDEVLFHGDPF